MVRTSPTVLALSGGVGGAKLALGLAQVVPSDALTVVVNTGDDFEHLGSPDLSGSRHLDVHLIGSFESKP